MKRKWINVFIFCAISICCKAQIEGYNYYTKLDSIKESGMYKILLSPVINGHLKIDYSDVRIINASHKWVPHVLSAGTIGEKNTAKIILPFSKIENAKTNSIYNIQFIGNKLQNISLNIRNTTAARYCTLSGSDTEKDWFVIQDSVLVNPTPSTIDGSNIFTLNFHTSTYKFYKLVILNGNKDPYEINEIATYDMAKKTEIVKNETTNNPATIFTQKDSGKISYIKVSQLNAFHFDEIKLAINGSKYFERRMEIFGPTGINHSITNPGKLVQSFVFSNSSAFNFKLPLINAIDFYILIYNEDNLPLKITEVETAYNNRYIKTYLEKGNSYRLIMDNEKAEQPNYDIATLNTDEIERVLGINSIEEFPRQKIIIAKEANNKWIVWTVLAAGLLLLLLLTKKLIKEVDKKTKNDTI